MATWVEDIVTALTNLGGEASLSQIYSEIQLIRVEPLPDNWKGSIRERIEAHSSDSKSFKSTDLFQKVDKGVWALRTKTTSELPKPHLEKPSSPINYSKTKPNSWVEDIVQALKNLGGEAHRSDIFEEIKRIRTVPLTEHSIEAMQGCIQAFSSDSLSFRGVDLFRKVGDGVWALRNLDGVDLHLKARGGKNEIKSATAKTETWLEDVIKALENLGGQATNDEICSEVRRIRKQPLPKSWKTLVMTKIYNNTADNPNNPGKDLFRWVAEGVWALQDPTEKNRVPTFNKHSFGLSKIQTNRIHERAIRSNFLNETNIEKAYQSFLPSEPVEEITNLLRTIKEYRDYQHPESSIWKDYVNEIFHILGFSTEEKDNRLITLKLMSSNHRPIAVVCYVKPNEVFEEIITGIEWETYLYYAARFFDLEWGIITNGLQLKAFYFTNQGKKQLVEISDLDNIVLQEKVDLFYPLFKYFSFLKAFDSKNVSSSMQL